MAKKFYGFVPWMIGGVTALVQNALDLILAAVAFFPAFDEAVAANRGRN